MKKLGRYLIATGVSVVFIEVYGYVAGMAFSQQAVNWWLMIGVGLATLPVAIFCSLGVHRLLDVVMGALD